MGVGEGKIKVKGVREEESIVLPVPLPQSAYMVPRVLGSFGGFCARMLLWAHLGIVLCELDESFKSLWILEQYCHVRQALLPSGWWYRWS